MKQYATLLLFAAMGLRGVTGMVDYCDIWVAGAFWGAFLVWNWIRYPFFLPGAVSNAIAMMANGGHMPVLTDDPKLFNEYVQLEGWHVLGTDATKFQLLCDRFHIPGIGIASIGDMLLFSTVVLAGGLWLAHRFWRTRAA